MLTQILVGSNVLELHLVKCSGVDTERRRISTFSIFMCILIQLRSSRNFFYVVPVLCKVLTFLAKLYLLEVVLSNIFDRCFGKLI